MLLGRGKYRSRVHACEWCAVWEVFSADGVVMISKGMCCCSINLIRESLCDTLGFLILFHYLPLSSCTSELISSGSSSRKTLHLRRKTSTVEANHKAIILY